MTQSDMTETASRWIAASGIPVESGEVRAWLDALGVPVPVGVHALMDAIRRAVIAAGDAGYRAGARSARDCWIVPKVEHDESRPVGPHVHGGWIHRCAGQSDPEHTRFYAAQLLAAADEGERRDREARP